MAWPNATPKQQRLGALALATVPLMCAGAFVLWVLHHPNPKARAPVPIDRNSLLPHRYPGPCINCHRINEIGPVSLNAGNMSGFQLTVGDRRLLLAGQRVDVPTLSQKLRIPAITRTDGLPHPYVGVCSNCHVVLDVHPSPEFMRQAMLKATQPLSGSNLSPALTARGGAVWDARREGYRRALGYAAVPFLLLATFFIAMRRFAAKEESEGKEASPTSAAWLLAHELSAIAFCVATFVHWHYSERGNNLLHVALLMTLGLTASGVFLMYRQGRRRKSKRSLLLTVQRVGLVLLVVLILVGHFLADFT